MGNGIHRNVAKEYDQYEGGELEEFPLELFTHLKKTRRYDLKICSISRPRNEKSPARLISLRLNFNRLNEEEFDNHFIQLNLQLNARSLLLKELLLSDNRINTIPWTLQVFKSIDTLYLHRNNISALPLWFAPSLGHCLRVLTLAENPISELPHNIDLLERLEEFYLRETQLKWLPSSIVRLQRLRILDLDFRSSEETAHFRQLNHADGLMSDTLGNRCLRTLFYHVVDRFEKTSGSVTSALKRWTAEKKASLEVLTLMKPPLLTPAQFNFLAQIAIIPSTSNALSYSVSLDGNQSYPPRCPTCDQLFVGSHGFPSFHNQMIVGINVTIFGSFCSQKCLGIYQMNKMNH